jgi:hypothetical protein
MQASPKSRSRLLVLLCGLRIAGPSSYCSHAMDCRRQIRVGDAVEVLVSGRRSLGEVLALDDGGPHRATIRLEDGADVTFDLFVLRRGP